MKNKRCNKETLAPYVTAVANRVVITLVSLSFLVLNSAKLPQDVSGGFPTLKAMNSPALPLAELRTSG